MGIDTRNYGSGTTTITTSAAITGGSGYAIRTITNAGSNSIANLNSATIVSVTSGQRISNNAGNSVLGGLAGRFLARAKQHKQKCGVR